MLYARQCVFHFALTQSLGKPIALQDVSAWVENDSLKGKLKAEGTKPKVKGARGLSIRLSYALIYGHRADMKE